MLFQSQLTYNRFLHKTGTLLGDYPAVIATHTIRNVALSLIGIFIPLFIFTLDGKPIIHTDDIINNLFWTLIFYLFIDVTIVLVMPISVEIMFGKLKFKNSIILGNIALAVTLFLLAASEWNFNYIFLSAFFAAFSGILYWIPFHLLFLRKADTSGEHMGTKFAMQLFTARGATAWRRPRPARTAKKSRSTSRAPSSAKCFPRASRSRPSSAAPRW